MFSQAQIDLGCYCLDVEDMLCFGQADADFYSKTKEDLAHMMGEANLQPSGGLNDLKCH